MVDHLPRKIKSSKIGIRMLECPKSFRIGRETKETLPIHWPGLHFKKTMWNEMVKIRLRTRSISWKLTRPPHFLLRKNMAMIFLKGERIPIRRHKTSREDINLMSWMCRDILA